jgi:hypothetical protein
MRRVGRGVVGTAVAAGVVVVRLERGRIGLVAVGSAVSVTLALLRSREGRQCTAGRSATDGVVGLVR